MDKFFFQSWSCSQDELQRLILISRTARSLIRLQQELEIASIVPIDQDFISSAKDSWLSGRDLTDALAESNWTEDILVHHLHLPNALTRFSSQRFSPGLEDSFLSTQGSRDQIVYSHPF